MFNTLSALLLIVASFNAYSVEIEGIIFNDQISLNDTKQVLTLNGAGLRQKFFFNIYAAGLYVETTSQDVDTLLNQNGSKLFVMHILYTEIEQDEMVNSTIDSFKKNLTATEYLTLEPRIKSFSTQYQTVKTGDILIYDYTPNKGTRFSINNTLKGVTYGSDFNTALLKIWLGNKPASKDLKNDLLGIK